MLGRSASHSGCQSIAGKAAAAANASRQRAVAHTECPDIHRPHCYRAPAQDRPRLAQPAPTTAPVEVVAFVMLFPVRAPVAKAPSVQPSRSVQQFEIRSIVSTTMRRRICNSYFSRAEPRLGRDLEGRVGQTGGLRRARSYGGKRSLLRWTCIPSNTDLS